VVRFTSVPLYPEGKSPYYPLDKRLVGWVPMHCLNVVANRKISGPARNITTVVQFVEVTILTGEIA
jgi:hypothetical protein